MNISFAKNQHGSDKAYEKGKFEMEANSLGADFQSSPAHPALHSSITLYFRNS